MTGAVEWAIEAATTGTGLSVVIAAFFAAMGGCIVSDIWLDQRMTRSKPTAWVLAVMCLIVAAWSVWQAPFG